MFRNRPILILIVCILALSFAGAVFAQETATYSLTDGSMAFEYPAGWVIEEEFGVVTLVNSQDEVMIALILYPPSTFLPLLEIEPDSTPHEVIEFILESGEFNGEIVDGTLNDFDTAYAEVSTAQLQLAGTEAAIGAYDSRFGVVLLAVQTGGDLSDYQNEIDIITESITRGDVEILTPTPRPAPVGETTVEGEITEESPALQYAVELSEGDVITVELVAVGSVFDTVLSLYAPGEFEDGGVAAMYNDDSGDSSFGSRNSRIEEFEVTESGTWVIEATRFGSSDVGAFTLTIRGDEQAYDIVQMDAIVVTQEAPPPLRVTPTATPSSRPPVTEGTSIDGELVEDSTVQQYRVELVEGDDITIELAAVDNAFDTRVRLYAPGDFEAGTSATLENDDSGDADFGSLNSRIADFSVTESGTWVIEATSFAGVSTGEYTLSIFGNESYTLTPLEEAEVIVTPEPTAGTATSVEGELTEDALAVPFTIDLTEGDVITIELVAQDAAFDPVVHLYAPGDYGTDALPRISDDDSGDAELGSLNSRIEIFTVTESGTWTIEATSFANRGVGAFTLTVIGSQPYIINAGVVEPEEVTLPVLTGDNVLVYNEPVTGTISAAEREFDWHFVGRAGDIVTITMVADDSDTLDPRIYLYSAEAFTLGGFELTQNDDSKDETLGSFNSRIADFTLPATGEYVVTAGCFIDCSGDYTLLITGEEQVVIPVEPTPTVDEVRQWAANASATSQYTDSGWSASQATGEPDTVACADQSTAWASSSSTGTDSLTLEFDQAVIPTQINIYQTYNPGSITDVQLITASGDVIDIPDSADPLGNTECPGVFTLDLSEMTEAVVGVIINLDQTIGGSWNEIDAVELVGITSTEEVVEPVVDVTALLTAGDEAFNSGDWAGAIAAYSQAIEIDSANGNAFFFRGYAYYNSGAYDNALRDFDQALELGTNDMAWVYNLRGLTYDRMGEYELSIAEYLMAIELVPTYQGAHQNLAYAYGIRLGDWKKYTEEYQLLVDLDPTNSNYYNGFGWGLVQQGRYRDALVALNEALELDSTNSSALDSRGWAHLGLENYEEAEADFLAAIEYGEIYSYYGLAELYHAQGDDVLALENLQAYLDIATVNPAADALALLETLQ